MAIADSTTHVLQLLVEAIKEGKAALVEVRERETGQPYTLLCLATQDAKNYQFFPVAIMIEGYDPFERFQPPAGGKVINVSSTQGGGNAVH